MIVIPTHSRRVKVITKTEFPRIDELIGSLTYETTEYCVYFNESQDEVLGVYSIQGQSAKSPFIRITEMNEIAAQASKRIVRDSELDVSNVLEILCRLEEESVGSEGPETVVFVSKHDHVTFAHLDSKIQLPEIQVVDVIPPSPSKLEVAFEMLWTTGVIPKDYPVKFNLINEAELVELADTGPILIPCRFTEIIDSSKSRIHSIDKDLHHLGKDEVHIVGCQRTREAAEAFNIPIRHFDDICPEQNLPDSGIFIAKCCLNRDEVEVKKHEEARGIIIPWGFNYTHVFLAGVALQEIIIEEIE